ncbi:MAG: enoyl-CoA hydratase/isomerase, partial [Hyphomonadaceae bacterium]
ATSKVKYARDGDVAIITLNDPGTLNSMDETMANGLGDAITQAGREARAAVITGEGRAFCSGANLTPGGSLKGGKMDAGESLERVFNPLMTRLRDMPIPFVTAVNGAAAGVGCSVGIVGDLVIAGESAYFLQAFRRIGLVPDGGSSYMLPRAIGRARAMEMMLMGDKIPAKTALDWGLVNRVVPDAEVMSTALGLAQELARGPRSLALIRKLVWGSLDNEFANQLKMERELQREAGNTSDFVEGVAAFRDKRPAKFTGA